MLKNFLQRKAAEALSSESYPPGDPLAPPKDKRDPRIDDVQRGYRTRCWVWRDGATADAARGRVWQDTYRATGGVIVNRCGHPHCVRASHLQRISARQQRTLSQILQYAGGGPDGVARSAVLIQALSRQLDWDYREWMALLDITEAGYRQGMADYEARVAADRARNAARENASPASPATIETVGSAVPSPALSSPANPTPQPPAMPILLKKAGPLGKPENLAAHPGGEPGQVILTWTPAKNAVTHAIAMVLPNTGEAVTYSEGLLGSACEVTFGGVAAGLWHFVVVAGEQSPDDSGGFVWSEQSNWASIVVP